MLLEWLEERDVGSGRRLTRNKWLFRFLPRRGSRLRRKSRPLFSRKNVNPSVNGERPFLRIIEQPKRVQRVARKLDSAVRHGRSRGVFREITQHAVTNVTPFAN